MFKLPNTSGVFYDWSLFLEQHFEIASLIDIIIKQNFLIGVQIRKVFRVFICLMYKATKRDSPLDENTKTEVQCIYRFVPFVGNNAFIG